MNLNRSSSHSHSVCRLFTVVLLGLFLIFLLVMVFSGIQVSRARLIDLMQGERKELSRTTTCIPLPPTYLSNFTSMTVRRAFSQTL